MARSIFKPKTILGIGCVSSIERVSFGNVLERDSGHTQIYIHMYKVFWSDMGGTKTI